MGFYTQCLLAACTYWNNAHETDNGAVTVAHEQQQAVDDDEGMPAGGRDGPSRDHAEVHDDGNGG